MPVAEVTSKKPAPQEDPCTQGFWELLNYELPFPAAHAALLPTGKVLMLPGGRKLNGAKKTSTACLCDERSGVLRTWDLPTDFSLGAQCFLSDGRLVIIGGGKHQNAIRLRETYLFDPATEDFLRVNDVPQRGPCPTLIQLGDGRVLAVGGAGRSRIHAYEKTTGWTATACPELDWPLYPHLTLLAEGLVFYSGQHFGGRALINPGLLHADTGLVEFPPATVTPDFNFDFRDQGATALLPPAQDQRVMIIGGGTPPHRDVHLVEFSKAEPVRRSAAPMTFGRSSFNTVVLPDHTILVCGGTHSDQNGRSAALEATLYDPSTAAWSSAAAAHVPRQEHSSAILLPDGRVLTAGSTDVAGRGELRVELYHPPYLFRGDRPLLEEVPHEIESGESFLIKTADSDIRRLSLVKPMAVSHGVDPGQRLVDVPFESRGSGILEAVAPEDPNIAPPGLYLLFLVNHNGTPSYGRFVKLTHVSGSNDRPATELRDEAGRRSKDTWKGLGRHSWNGSNSGGEPLLRQAGGPHSSEPLPLVPESAPVSVATAAMHQVSDRLEELSSPSWPEEPIDFESLEEPAGGSWLEELSSSPWLADPAVPGSPEELSNLSLPEEWVVQRPLEEPAGFHWLLQGQEGFPLEEEPADRTLLVEPSGQSWLDEPAIAVWDDERPAVIVPDNQTLRVSSSTPVDSVPMSPWYRWARPALIIGSAGLLALSMILELAPLRAAAAFIFLLFGPGMAIVGLYRPSGLASELALATGLSVALETLLTLAMLYFRIWSADRLLLTLIAGTLVGATVQLFKAALGAAENFENLEELGESPA